jgi:hypothetical protein
MKKCDLIASMTFSDDYVPDKFTKPELEALKANSSIWDDAKLSEAVDIVWKMRGLQA